MVINGQHFHTIWVDESHPDVIKVIDQQKLPWELSIKSLRSFEDAFNAIKDMTVRGAPLIGVTAAFGIYLGLMKFDNKESLPEYISRLCATMKTARPTAINLAFAVDRVKRSLEKAETLENARSIAFESSEKLKHDEIDFCNRIGDNGLVLIEEILKMKNGETVNILTHCNAGWLACIDWGTALAPVYKAHQKKIPVHVWVDETRPRNQGSYLTAFELQQEGVQHTVITDNTGGYLMQHGLVDLVLVGSDRTTRTGDVCNKIGTYQKALAAKDNNIPFYVALPLSSFDLTISDGIVEIPIEERDGDEVKFIVGKKAKIQVIPDGSPVVNYGFDVTPARLVTGLITEKGICGASETEILKMFENG
jgi:methylthioribose-1-phosphate isomerase